MNAEKTDKPPAKPAKDTIYIDVEDEITSIIDKVEASSSKIVALVLPKRSTALQSIVNMRLLKRSVVEAQKRIVLVTNEAAILPLAGAAGIHVAKNLQSKPYIPPSPVPLKPESKKSSVEGETDEKLNEKNATLDYHRSIGELAVSEEAAEPETIHLKDDEKTMHKDGGAVAAGAPKTKKLKVPNFDKFRNRLWLLTGGFIALIIFLILAAKVLPKATITINEDSTPVSANFDVTTLDSAKAVDVEKAIVPAVVKTADQTSSQQIAATGQQNNGTKATGSVSMTATKCAPNIGQPASVPAGAGLSANGLTYITQGATSFSSSPSGGSGSCVTYGATSSTAIAAQTGGAKYNVSSATFSVSGRSDVSASGSASGGTDNLVTVVSQTDIDNAKKKITSQSSDEFSKDFTKKLDGEGFYLVTSSLKIADPAVTASPDIGQPAANVQVTIKITYSVLAIKKDDMKQVVSSKLKKQIDASKQQILDSDLLKNVTTAIKSQTSPANTTLGVIVNASATPLVDVEAIKKQVGGQKSGDIRSSIEAIPGVKDVKVKLSPFWVSKAPKNPSKIKIILVKVNDGG